MDQTSIQEDAARQAQLEAELATALSRIEGVSGELGGIEAELEALADARERYELLGQAHGALEGLESLGAGELFWADAPVAGGVDAHLRRVKERVDAFGQQLGEIEERRQGVVQELERLRYESELIDDELEELNERKEARKLEWVVEREIGPEVLRATIMPWTRGGEDDRRFRKSLAIALLASLLLGLILPLIDLPIPEGWEAVEVPDRLTRLIREEATPPPAPVAQETLQQESSPEKAEETKTAEETPKEVPKPDTGSKGILAFREQFSELAADLPSARLGSEARIRNPGEAVAGRSQRSLVATRGTANSGGIDIGSLSRDVGGGGGSMEGVAVARASSSIGTGGGADRPLSSGPGPARTDEEIQIVFDRHKAALYRLYNRELRKNPTLRGQMVLRITIEPDGSVSLCELQSTDMKAPRLVEQVLSRVRTFDFGAKDGVPAITILYPIDFLPAT